RDDKSRAAAQQLLDRVIAAYPRAPRTEFARLNKALLMLRTGDVAGAQTALRDWIRRAPFPPLLGRAQAALGAALLATGRQGEAANAFTQAQAEGAGPLSALGLGSVALAQSQRDVATAKPTEARDSGTAGVGAVRGRRLAAI